MAGPTPAWNTVPVFKHCRNFDGTACVGTVTFTPTAIVRDNGNKITVYPTTLSATLDSTGSYTQDLPASDDTDITGTFVYHYKESWSGLDFFFALPLASAGAGFDVGTATPLVPSDTYTGYVTTEQFQTQLDTHLVHSDQVRALVKCTQAQYDALSSPSPTALYVIVG